MVATTSMRKMLSAVSLLFVAALGIGTLAACSSPGETPVFRDDADGAPGNVPDAGPNPDDDDSAASDTDELDADEGAAPSGLETTDFGNLSWVFRPDGSSDGTEQVELVDGKATDGTAQYELGEVLFADLTGDGIPDAAAQLTRLDGNAIDDQWYLWVSVDGVPSQVTMPVARAARCGTAIHSVEVVDEGIQIHESRRNIGEEGLDCASTGTDERTRVVTAVETSATKEWWPAQVAPVPGFGGLCPVAAEYEGFPHAGELYPAPDTGTQETTGGAQVNVFTVEGWPVYGEAFPGWTLVGVMQSGEMLCAWAEVPQ